MPRPAVISLSGPSGVGKTVLLKWLLEVIKPSGLVPSYTTRVRRPSDIGEYTYITPEQFRELKERKEFAWFVDEYGNQYGTRGEDLHQAVVDSGKSGKISMLLVVPKTINNLRQHIWSSGGIVLSFYIYCSDDDVLCGRLLERDNDGVMVRRRIEGSKHFNRDAQAIRDIHWIDNSRDDNLNSAKEQILYILRSEDVVEDPNS
jgi:guanylate kinase